MLSAFCYFFSRLYSLLFAVSFFGSVSLPARGGRNGSLDFNFALESAYFCAFCSRSERPLILTFSIVYPPRQKKNTRNEKQNIKSCDKQNGTVVCYFFFVSEYICIKIGQICFKTETIRRPEVDDGRGRERERGREGIGSI